ncbi:MAG: AMP-binding protein [Spirochaetales bacterium]|nr:AMP-binding protein [Spirochaetales bacterium]
MANTLAQLFLERVALHPDSPAQFSKNGGNQFVPTSYRELKDVVAAFATGLAGLGVGRGSNVGLIADNRKEWLATDLALLGLGAADVPRGCDATAQEIAYILDWSECALTVLENEKQLAKVLERKAALPVLKTAILMDMAGAETLAKAKAAGLEVRAWQDVLADGKTAFARDPGLYDREAALGKRDERATLIYTSGTTGEPKGVELTHGNFLHQVEQLLDVIHVETGHVFLTVLPIWHSFERAVQYIVLGAGAATAYSKPVGSIMLADLQAVKPQWLTSVPRIWESVKDGVYRNIKAAGGIKKSLFGFFVAVGALHAHFRNMVLGRLPDFGTRVRIFDILVGFLPWMLLSPIRGLGHVLVFHKILEKLGGRFIAGISGGGALPPSVDRFFGAIGVLILEGYGLTETAPVLAVREQDRPVAGTVGPAIFGTELVIEDETGKRLGPGRKGVIKARGPQLMKGYYRKPELTAKVISKDGWLDTGDLGMLTRDGCLRITGRAKDTIVLLGGENIEPLPIEQKLMESEYVQQAVVLGQDKRYLTALMVPNQDAVMGWARDNEIPVLDYETLLKQPEVLELVDGEVQSLVSAKNGFKAFERIFRFKLLPVPFEVGKELSAKQEVKRHAVNEIYAAEIKALFKE